MVLNDDSIKSRQLVRNAVDANYRAASYDLTVGAVISSEGKIVDEHLLPPQGMVKVVSAEEVDLPPDVTGYVHVKTKLCNEGVLTLNIGIVDPCFSGPLQSTIINFGKNPYRLKKGSVFGRITFHDQVPPVKVPQPVVRTAEQVRNEAVSDLDRFLAPDFLNFSRTVAEAADKATEKFRSALFIYVPVLALVLTLLTFLLNFGNMWKLERYINVDDLATARRQDDDIAAKLTELESSRKQLEEELQRLRDQVNRPPPERPVPRRSRTDR